MVKKYAKTQSVLATALNVTRATIVEWCRQQSFPPKTRNGYNIAHCTKWAEKNRLGSFRIGSGGKATNVRGVTLTEAKIRHTLEQAENERIKKERQLVGQAKELGQIVDLEEVLRAYNQTASIVIAIIDSAIDAADRAMPDTTSPDVRDRVLGIIRKIHADTYAALKNQNDSAA